MNIKVFFSTLENLFLQTTGTKEWTKLGSCMKLLWTLQVACPYTLCWQGGKPPWRLGEVPLLVFPCFLDGNTTSTIQYKYTAMQKQAFQFSCADSQGPAPCRGCHVYEINTLIWIFGRPQPQVGGLSVGKTERIWRQSRSETSRRTWETVKTSKDAAEEIWQAYTWYMHIKKLSD
jgi:hypothetical protein